MTIRTQGLCLVIRPRRGPDFLIRPSALLLIAITLMTGLVVHGFLETYQAHFTNSPVVLQSSQIFLFASIYIAGVIAHELGHVAIYLACSLGWRRTIIGPSASVVPLRRPTRAQQVVIAATGPIAQSLMGCVVALLSQGNALMLIAGMLLLLEGVCNLLLPLSHNSDAAKLYRNLHACLQGRGNEIIP